MMDRRVETRDDGMVVIQDVYDGKSIVQKVMCGWFVLFTDADGCKRFGYVIQIDLEQRQFIVLDAIAYPNAPSPIGAKGEVVSFAAVIIAQGGFNWLRDEDIYAGGKKLGKRRIAIIIKGYERDADVGWLARKSNSVYVDKRDGKWQLRS
jgi:hypothetical protein